jgi:acetyl-CoA acetyltransferase
MPETAENVAQQFNVGRADQDAFALRSQQRTAEAIAAGRLAEEMVEVTIQARRAMPSAFDRTSICKRRGLTRCRSSKAL